jgi:putative phosphoribosyl transferase
MQFIDRKDAGKQLAHTLEKYRGTDAIIFALPRGGVILGYEIAKALDLPLDLVIARKIGHPVSPEYAIASVTENGEMSVNEAEVAQVKKEWFDQEVKKEQEEAKRRREKYLEGISPPNVSGRTAIIVDDGLATGLTMESCIKEVRKRGPKKIVVAVPVSPADTKLKITKLADEMIVLSTPVVFLGAIDNYYDKFPQVEDEEVIELMRSISQKI